ncbi:MAG: PD-(D/E)XK nuclease family transposase [Leptospiraceae bacterium]|nr:PD-(D/E)XK nuclease family transposase [Leptospiraceae bacterium]
MNRQILPQKIIYYWSKFYSRAIIRGENYNKLPKVYSINFINSPYAQAR